MKIRANYLWAVLFSLVAFWFIPVPKFLMHEPLKNSKVISVEQAKKAIEKSLQEEGISVGVIPRERLDVAVEWYRQSWYHQFKKILILPSFLAALIAAFLFWKQLPGAPIGGIIVCLTQLEYGWLYFKRAYDGYRLGSYLLSGSMYPIPSLETWFWFLRYGVLQILVFFIILILMLRKLRKNNLCITNQ